MTTRGLDLLMVQSMIKSTVPFVISAVVAYRLLNIGMGLGAGSAVALGSWSQQ
jgi:hypothetical protein